MTLLLFFCLLTLGGISILLFFRYESSIVEIIGIGFVIGPLIFTWNVFLISFFVSLSSAILISIITWFCLIFGIFSRKHFRNRLKEKIVFQRFGYDKTIPLVLLGVFTLIFIWLFPKIILIPSEMGWHVGLNSFGDTQFHVAVISSFAYGENIPPQNPLFSGVFFSYPFIADFFSAILIKIGNSLRLSMLIPTIIFSLSIVYLIFFLTKRFAKSVTATISALIFFFFNGGIEFWYFIQNNKGSSLFKSLLFLNKDYTHIFEENMHFTNIISGFLEQERSLLFGLPIFIIVLLFLFDERNKKSITTPLILGGILYGLLPLTHSHAFFILTAVVGWYAAFDILFSKNKKEIIKKWLGFFIPGVIMALPQILCIFPQVFEATGGFVHQYWGWMKKPEEQWFIYWFKTVGPIFILVPLALISSKVSSFLKFLFLPFLIIFLAANIWIFQPYNFDNVKFFIFVLLGSSIFAGIFLAKWWNEGKIAKIIIILILLFSSISGLLSIWAEPKPHNLLYSKEDLGAADFIRNNIENRAIFLTGPQHSSPVLLAGRKILMGYQGYLWVHGINYSEREKDIKNMYQGNRLLLDKYNVSYIFLDHEANRAYQPNKIYLDQNFSVIFESLNYKIYKVVHY